MKTAIDRAPLNAVQLLALVGAALLLWYLRGVVAMAFASILIGIALVALADMVHRLTRMPRGWALALVVLAIIGFVAAAIALFGWRVADQADAILAKAQQSLAELASFANRYAWTAAIAEQFSRAPLDGAATAMAPRLASVIGAFGQNLAYVAIVIASGIFLAVNPGRYANGVLLLAPEARRPQVTSFMAESGLILRKWLVSRLVVMLVIGALSSAGLWLLGIEGALTLGITGGLLTFIPLIGALIAAVPAVLVAMAQSPLLALYTALMYWAVHFIEGTFITPYVQDERVNLPPVVTLYSTVVFAAIFGVAGVFFASPLALVAIVGLQTFYVRRESARGLAEPVVRPTSRSRS